MTTASRALRATPDTITTLNDATFERSTMADASASLWAAKARVKKAKTLKGARRLRDQQGLRVAVPNRLASNAAIFSIVAMGVVWLGGGDPLKPDFSAIGNTISPAAHAQTGLSSFDANLIAVGIEPCSAPRCLDDIQQQLLDRGYQSATALRYDLAQQRNSGTVSAWLWVTLLSSLGIMARGAAAQRTIAKVTPRTPTPAAPASVHAMRPKRANRRHHATRDAAAA